MGYVKAVESASGLLSVFNIVNSISDIPSVSQHYWWVSQHLDPLVEPERVEMPAIIEGSIDFLVLKCTDLNLKLSPLDGVGSIAGSGLFGRLNGAKKVFEKIFLKNFVIVFSRTSLQQRLHGALSPHMI